LLNFHYTVTLQLNGWQWTVKFIQTV